MADHDGAMIGRSRGYWRLRALRLPVGAALGGGTLLSIAPVLWLPWVLIGLPVILFGLIRIVRVLLFRDAMAGLVMALTVWPLMGFAWFVGDYVHAALFAPYYVWVVSRAPDQPHSFYWGSVGMAGGPPADKSLVYDPVKAHVIHSDCEPIPDWPGVVGCPWPLIGGFYMTSLH